MNKRKSITDYSIFCHDNLVIFDFFLPLTHEGKLKNSLDILFYKDSVIKRLKSIDSKVLQQYFSREAEESDEEYLQSISAWVSTNFSGYSINHVYGRYRAKELCNLQQAYRYIENGDNYLIDETTAVARFIFPCGESRIVSGQSFEPDFEKIDETDSKDLQREYNKIRFLFFKLFVQNIVQIANEEDEIWMMESGMRHRLYSWRVK
ncbi:MAG: hypothetical protein PQJ61_12695 [Spirochaetales bacterium]|uniref:Uncharacterized protein n=1 Tax=Candidatus Thalassospirochaeta sargassi TaxID=3119039 RepID=A0AAJ1MND2_9SPIO|nr:hypothetical protein [Spirochaetales bacterium]